MGTKAALTTAPSASTGDGGRDAAPGNAQAACGGEPDGIGPAMELQGRAPEKQDFSTLEVR